MTENEVLTSLERASRYLVVSQDIDGSWNVGPKAVNRNWNNTTIRSAITSIARKALTDSPARGAPEAVVKADRFVQSTSILDEHSVENPCLPFIRECTPSHTG